MAQRRCPICKRPVEDDRTKSPFLPFCSDRCKKIDLAAWLDGAYRISRNVEEEDLDEGPRGFGGDGEEPRKPN